EVLMYLGGCYEESGNMPLSNQAFHRAYQADKQNPSACQVSALAFLREGKTDAARARLKEAEQLGQPADPGIALGVAQALHQENRSQESAELLQAVSKVAPNAHKDKGFRKLAKSVEQATGAPGSLAPPRSLFASPAFWWAAAAVAVASGLVCRDLYLTSHQAMFVVNGLPTPITVQIDDREPLTLDGGSRRQLAISGGEHKVRVVSPDALADEAGFAIESSRSSRWFRQPVHVLSPTRSSVVFWEETVFSDKQQANVDPGFELAVGRLITSYDNADYLFREFPQSLEVKDTTKQVLKSRVDTADFGPMGLVVGDPQQLRNPFVLDYLEPHLLFGGGREALLRLYTNASLQQDAMDRAYRFLEAHLEEKPVDLDWHKTFQSVAALQGEADLTARYERLLEASPRDPSLLYLRGRLESFGQPAAQFYRRALAVEPSHARTLAAIAFSEACHGDFESALRSVQKAIEIEPEMPSAADLREELLIALGRYEDLEEECRQKLQAAPMSFGASVTLMTSQAARGRVELARQTQESFAETLTREWPDDPHELGKRVEEKLLRFSGDYQAAERVASSMTDPRLRNSSLLLCALLNGDPARAEEIVQQLPAHQQGESLLWCSLVRATAQDPEADAARERAAALLETDGGPHREVARLFRKPPGSLDLAKQAADLELEADTKVAVLLLLAENAGDQGPEMMRLARRLNRMPSDFQPLLTSALSAYDQAHPSDATE
ncbi:MAG: hypothetical protein KDA37_10615, partial [Planctomycetales bacterium]|nr:hypothetical protein [Planctomycetales bacterium]